MRARPCAMFHVLGNVQPRSRASFAMAALRLPIQSRGASAQMACCASTADTCKSLHVFCNTLLTGFSMFDPMSRANTWKPLGALTTRIAARLMARREADILAGDAEAARVQKKPAPNVAGRLPADITTQGGNAPAGVLEEGGRTPEGTERPAVLRGLLKATGRGAALWEFQIGAPPLRAGRVDGKYPAPQDAARFHWA